MAVVIVLVRAVQWLLAHGWALVVLAAVVVVVGGVAWWRSAQRAAQARARAGELRLSLAELDALHHQEFEIAVRDLMRRDGCRAERVGGAGDDACDVKAVDPAGRVWAIQCKHRRDGERGSAVGVGVLQQVNGTARQVHGADVAVVLTNGRFSAPAIPWGSTHHIHLVNRQLLGAWAAGHRPLWELITPAPPPRRPAAPP